LVAAQGLPPNDLIPSLLATSDVLAPTGMRPMRRGSRLDGSLSWATVRLG
jgi:hypothetical protein